MEFEPYNGEVIPIGGGTGQVKIPGNPANNISVRQNNPFNIKGNYWGASGVGTRGFAIYDTPEAGWQAGVNQIRLDQKRNLTLGQFAEKYAPAFENPTWAKDVSKMLGVSLNTPLNSIPTDRLINVVAKRESSATRGGNNLERRMGATAAATPAGNFVPYEGEVIPLQQPMQPPQPAEMTPYTGEVAPTQPQPPATPPQPAPLPTAQDMPVQAPGGVPTQPQTDLIPPAITGTPEGGKGGLTAPVGESPLWGKIREPLATGAKAIDTAMRWPVPEKVAGPGVASTILDVIYPKTQKEAMVGGVAGLGMGIVRAEPGGAPGFIPKPGRELAARQELSALEKIVGMERFNPEEMQELMTVAKRDFGIELTVPELTNSPTLKAHWVALAKTPGTPAEKLSSFIENIRTPQVAQAIEQELTKISPASLDPFQAGGQARAAAKGIENKIVDTRKAVTQPIYKAAFENPQPVDTGPILENLTTEMGKYPEGHPSRAALQQVERMLTKEDSPITDLETLHNTKTGIDQLLEKAKSDKSIDNDTRRLLMRTKAKLQGQMEADNPLYGKAQKTFRLLSKPLNDFRFGNPNIAPRDPHVNTVIKRLAELPEANLEKAVDIVFSGNRPQQIAKTKAYFDKAYPGTWDAMVRTKLEQELGKAKDSVVNRSGNIGLDFKRRVWNTANDRNKWVAALGPEKFNRLNKFMEVLDKTSRIVYTSSETPFQLAAQKIQDQGGATEFLEQIPTSTGGAIKKTLRWVSEKFDKTKRADFRAQLTDAMLDPVNAVEIARLARLTNPTRQVIETAEFLSKIGPVEVAPKLTTPRTKD